MTLKDYEISWKYGRYRAVRSDLYFGKRNVAPYDCTSKEGAIQAARWDCDELNDEIDEDT